jgi:DNA-binding NtrC family response regulator
MFYRSIQIRCAMGSTKVLSVGLGDLVSCRNAALRVAGFEVVAAICLEDLAHACTSSRFDVAVVGCTFPIREKIQFVRCLQGVFRVPVILITGRTEYMASMRANSYIHMDAPLSDLLCAVNRLAGDPGPQPLWPDR